MIPALNPLSVLLLTTPFNLKEFDNDKESILDVRAQAKDQRIINVEIQTARQGFYVHRSLYYWARLYQGQLKNGEAYDILSPVICINLLDFTIFDAIKEPHSCFLIAEKDHPEYVLTNDFQLHFYEMPKYQENAQSQNQLERWACFFQCEGKSEKGETMEILLKNDPILTRAHKEYVRFTEDKELRMAYEAREKYHRDQLFMLSSAKREGIKEGIEQGLSRAAAEMKRSGMDPERIRQFTGLSLEDIARI
ncbi:MAG: hypothetical protein CSB28_00460 [Desulfobacterales bacterium]|nr:MAG: hypothetical protein CSB28_00460 [Desulfobacterales bacterium]